jgi:hypothetical protein
MANNYWNNCSYYESGTCPQPEAIDRVFLIPQLLDTSEVEAIEQICLTCGKYLDKKRKHPRIKRPLQIILLRGRKTALEGDVVNISKGGVLVKLRDWVDFEENEKVTLKIYTSRTAGKKTSTPALKVSAQVKRIEAPQKQLAIIFLSEIDH